jgi:hypothetical protein
LPKQYRADFKLATQNLFAELELAKTRTLALQDD